MGHAGVTGFFTQLGIPLPGMAAWGVSFLEFGGGLMLAAGLLTRPLALLFAGDMIAAIGFAVFPKGFVGGYELEFLLAAASVALAVGGAGLLAAGRATAVARAAPMTTALPPPAIYGARCRVTPRWTATADQPLRRLSGTPRPDRGHWPTVRP
jgi:putative oxidoreductase